MKYLLLLILLSGLIITCYSAVYVERQLEIPGYEDLCYDKEDNVFYKNGEEMRWKSKECGRKICKGSDGRESVFIEFHTCGKIGGPPECHIEVNLNLPYPRCCGQLICPEFREIEGNSA